MNLKMFLLLFFLGKSLTAGWAEEKLKQMSPEEKIGQLMIVACAADRQKEQLYETVLAHSPYTMDQKYIESLIKQYHIGGHIFMLKTDAQEFVDKSNRYQQLSKTPLLSVLDAEWGPSMRINGLVKFPRNMTLGAIEDEQLLFEFGKEVGRQCKELGVHINCAPVVDVNNNSKNPVIHTRSFGENPQDIARKGVLVMKGMQAAGIIACAKHFPGHGDTDTDSHVDLPVLKHSKERLNKVELHPFKEMIKNGVGAVMGAHLQVEQLDNEQPSSLSKKIMTNLLKKEMGFEGLVLTDGLGMEGVTKHYESGEIELKALQAGSDLLICPRDVPKAVEVIKMALEQGIFSEQALDEKVLKVLRAKERFELHKQFFINNEKILKNLVTEDVRQLKKQLYHQAITAVRNAQHEVSNQNNRKIRVLQIGGSPESCFATKVKEGGQYCQITFAPKQLSKTDINEIVESITDEVPIVVAIFGMNNFATKEFGVDQSVRELINELRHRNKKVSLALFGSPYSLVLFENDIPVIVGYEDDEDVHEAMAQVVAGKMKPSGKLPVTID